MKQTKPFICKDEEACNLWSHTQVYHPGADHLRSAQTLRYNTTRNRFCCLNCVCSSGMLCSCCPAARQTLRAATDSRSASDNTVRQFWVYAITPICFLELLPQLGGRALLIRGPAS